MIEINNKLIDLKFETTYISNKELCCGCNVMSAEQGILALVMKFW